MKSRTTFIILIPFFCIVSLCSQNTLTRSLQGFRSGDVLCKEQVKYKDPGRRGKNIVWDFSRLNTINEEYGVRYIEPEKKCKDSLLVTCIEHNTMYKYALKGDSLFMLGFENSGSKLVLGKPGLYLTYPFTYGDSITSIYNGTGSYVNTLLSEADGILTTVADGMGTLILPDGDTLFNVLRVRSEQRYEQRTLPIIHESGMRAWADTICINEESSISLSAMRDSSLINTDNYEQGNEIYDLPRMYGKDKITFKGREAKSNNASGKSQLLTRKKLLNEKTDSILYRTQICRWYAPGYRYPLFETICNRSHLTRIDTTEMDDIATAFYFPPSSHTYLGNDPENQAIIDSLLTVHETGVTQSTDSLLFDYNYYPNPVKSNLYVELLLDKPSTVTFRIFDSSGMLVLTSQEGFHPSGINNFTLKTNRLQFGEHVLHIVVNNQTAHAVLLKI